MKLGGKTNASPCNALPPSEEVLTTKSKMEPHRLSPNGIPRVDTFPVVPELWSSGNIAVHDDRSISPVSSHSSYSSRSTHLYTIMEKRPQTYQPTLPTLAASLDLPANFSEADDATLKPPMLAKSRNVTTSTVDSIAPHQGGVIHIRPSPQLQSMQKVKDYIRDCGNFSPYEPWTRSNIFLTQSESSLQVDSYVPSGTPQAIFNSFKKLHVDTVEDRALSLSSPQTLGITKGEREWSKAYECSQPNTIVEEPTTQWIENYLARKDTADRLEVEARRKQEKGQKWNLSRVDSLKAVNKLVRRLSSSGSSKRIDPSGFTPRQERASKPRNQDSRFLEYQQDEELRTQACTHAPDSTNSNKAPHRRSSMPSPPTKRPALKQRFHTVSGASLSKFLLRKVQSRHSDSQDEEASGGGGGGGGGVRRSFSVNLGRKASIGARDFIGRWEKLGGKGKKEIGRADRDREG